MLEVVYGGATDYRAYTASIGTPHPCEKVLLLRRFEGHLVNCVRGFACAFVVQVPTEEFFAKDMGLALEMTPNYEDFSCQVRVSSDPYGMVAASIFSRREETPAVQTAAKACRRRWVCRDRRNPGGTTVMFGSTLTAGAFPLQPHPRFEEKSLGI